MSHGREAREMASGFFLEESMKRKIIWKKYGRK
jgi:hypothetical protein